jgi:hypothetical protein
LPILKTNWLWAETLIDDAKLPRYIQTARARLAKEKYGSEGSKMRKEPSSRNYTQTTKQEAGKDVQNRTRKTRHSTPNGATHTRSSPAYRKRSMGKQYSLQPLTKFGKQWQPTSKTTLDNADLK